MSRKAVLLTVIFRLWLGSCSDVTKRPDPAQVCFLPRDSGHCFTGLMRMWFYDSNEHICRAFMFGGCGGNDNKFFTEEDCYAVCKEKLVYLKAPANVSVGYSQHDKIFIYWYQPENFQLHNENGTVIGNPITDIVTTQKPPISTAEESKTSNNSRTTVTSIPSVQTSQKSVNHSTKNITNDQTDSKNSSYDLKGDSKDNKENGTTSVSNDDNVTEVPNTNKSAVNSDTKDSNSKVNLDGGVNLQLSDYIGKNPVPFHFAKLKYYILSYKKQDKEFINKTVRGNETDYGIENLEHSTKYIIILTAVYLTNTSVSSPPLIAYTGRDPSAERECHCDGHGTIGGYKTCNLTISQLPWCRCKKGYSGLFCEICARGYYRTTPSLPCHPCPCDQYSSTGSCHFVDAYLHCSQCKPGYAGQLCHRCENGYHRDMDTSPTLCKKCEGCHETHGFICNQYTGQCLNCLYNTTGFKCEKCLEGFVGDPSNNVSCVPATGKKSYTPPPSGLIAAIVISVIVALSVIIGCIVYNKMKTNPTMKPFWTIELKQDHEGVNFSSVPDQDFDGYRDDEQYQERSSKKSKSQPYLQLKEEI